MNNKNLILIALTIIILTGCGGETNVKPLPPTEIFRNQLVLVTVPEDFFQIPDNIPPVDTSKMTQREVAEWVAKNEHRTNVLENKILGLRELFVKSYDLIKSTTSNVIVIDTTKSDEFNKKTLEEANKKPIVVQEPLKKDEEKVENTGFLTTIKEWFSSKPASEETKPVEIKPAN